MFHQIDLAISSVRISISKFVNGVTDFIGACIGFVAICALYFGVFYGLVRLVKWCWQ